MEQLKPFRRRLRVHLVIMLILSIACWLLVLNAPQGPLRTENLNGATSMLPVDEDLDIAAEFAPRIVHLTHPEHGRQDIPTPIDFDGDFNGDNNWENFPRFSLLPAVYYSVLETESHWFITYHLFHPRDWTIFDLGLHLTHEGDGENLQLVVRKDTRTVELLCAQAHYKATLHPGAAWSSSSDRGMLSTPLQIHPATGRVVVVVESGGHGILSPDTPDPESQLEDDMHCIIYEPGAQFGLVAEPDPETDHGTVQPCRLVSLHRAVWNGVLDGSLVGDGAAFDGIIPYRDERTTVQLPRFHEGNRYSGPLGADRGISPFALDITFDEETLGRLFFDPAQRYTELIDVPADWSTTYLRHPFVTSGP